MLIVALVLAVVGLAALVTAVVTSNELVAWVCIAASVIGVILLIVDAIRERQHAASDVVEPQDDSPLEVPSGEAIDETYKNFDAEYPDEDEPSVEPSAQGQTQDLETVAADEVNADETPPSTRPDSV